MSQFLTSQSTAFYLSFLGQSYCLFAFHVYLLTFTNAAQNFLKAALADTNQFWEVFMLKKWTTHSDYLSYLNREIDSLSPHEKSRLFKLHQNSLLKLSLLNLDPLLPVVKPLYPELGRPAKN